MTAPQTSASTTITALRPMPPGRPGQHLGASHVAKHWLDPTQYWGDLAGALDLPDALHPASVAASVAAAGEDRPHTINPQSPSPGLHVAWPILEEVLPVYMGVVQAALAAAAPVFRPPLSASPTPPRQKELNRGPRQRGARVALLLPGGIIAIGDTVPPQSPTDPTEEPTEMRLRTAFRPRVHRGARHGQGAADAQSRALRISLSELSAARAFLSLTQRSQS